MDKKSTEEELGERIEKILGGFEDSTEVHLFDNPRGCGLQIHWTLKGIGFGELVLGYDKVLRQWGSDTERMDKETVTKILIMAAGQMANLMVELDP